MKEDPVDFLIKINPDIEALYEEMKNDDNADSLAATRKIFTEKVIQKQKDEDLSKNKDKSGYEILFDDIGATFDASKQLVNSALNATSSFSPREFEDIPEMMNPGAGPDGILPKLAITSSQFVGMSQPQMLDVIREQDPNAVFSKDKYKLKKVIPELLFING